MKPNGTVQIVLAISLPDADALLALLGSTTTFPDVVEALREALNRCTECESPLLGGECTCPYCAKNPDAKPENLA